MTCAEPKKLCCQSSENKSIQCNLHSKPAISTSVAHNPETYWSCWLFFFSVATSVNCPANFPSHLCALVCVCVCATSLTAGSYRGPCYTGPALQHESGVWWYCRPLQQPTWSPSSARNWSSGTQNRRRVPGYSCRWSTEREKVQLWKLLQKPDLNNELLRQTADRTQGLM